MKWWYIATIYLVFTACKNGQSYGFAKNVKLTIYHITFIQVKAKYSILLLQHDLKKLLYCQKVVGGKNDANVFFFWSLR